MVWEKEQFRTMFKILVLCAIILACEGKIEIPGLENIEKCGGIQEECIKKSADQITKALAKPYAPFSVEGYDPFVIDKLDLINKDFKIDQYFSNVKLTGFADTKVISLTPDPTLVKVSYKHTFKFSGNVKIVFGLNPEVVREGPMSGEFVDVVSHFEYPATKELKDGKLHLVIGKERLTGVELSAKPNLNQEQLAYFMSQPETQDIVKNVQANRITFYTPLAEALVKAISPRMFADKRKFYENVSLNELYTAAGK